MWIFGEHQLQNLECEHHFVHLYTEDLARRWFCDVRAVPSFRTWSAQTVMHTPHIGVPPFRYLYLLFFKVTTESLLFRYLYLLFLVTTESLLFGYLYIY